MEPQRPTQQTPRRPVPPPRPMTRDEYRQYLATLQEQKPTSQAPFRVGAYEQNRQDMDELRPIAPVRAQGQIPAYDAWGRIIPPVRQRKSHTVAWTLVCLFCIGVIVLTALFTLDQYKGNDLYQARAATLQDDRFYNGVLVDGLHLGGMTVQEARQLLDSASSSAQNQVNIRIHISNLSWQVTNDNIPFTRNLDTVLAQAFAVGRTTSAGQDAGSTFEQRLQIIEQVGRNGAYLHTETTYRREDVRAICNQIAAQITREPVDAQIASFSYDTRTFTFTDEVLGVTIDPEQLYASLIACLDNKEYQANVTVEPIVTTPTVTRASLAACFGLVSTYTTDTTSDKDRNNNISLSAQALNGVTLLPGQAFSFNECTGKRTADKGYRQAGVIAGGKTIEDYGGGVCQMSSTLMNAVARADLEITERSPHAWPSSYVKKGQDATVDYPSLDFKFVNNTDYPVFLVAWYASRKVTVEIYGKQLENGMRIDLYSDTIKTSNPPSEPKYVQNTAMPYGESETTIKARKGYVVDTYKVYYDQNGNEIKREKLFRSTYKTYQETIEYNW